MSKYIIPFIISILIFTACDDVVDAENLLDTEEKIFISSYISPQDTVIRVNVSRALATIGTPLSRENQEANESLFLIKNAEVTISDSNGNSASLQYSEENKTYLADANTLAILTNQSYFLKVTVDGNEYNASCSIPEKVSALNELINIKDSDYGQREGELNVSFLDIKGERNFYILGGLIKATFQYEDEETETFSSSLFFDSDEFQIDNLEDGNTINGKSTFFFNSGPEFTETQITTQVANVEEILFQNLRSESINSDNEGNPFIEYAIAPSNFDGEDVVGVFAGYQITEKVIDLDL